jgi:chromosome segregation ATPase
MVFKSVVVAFCLAQTTALEVHTQTGRLYAPVDARKEPAHSKQQAKKKVDLTDVIVQAVELMDAGISQFLKEESSTELPPVEKNPDDFAKIVKSQHKAMQVVRQMSSNFIALKDVAKKLKKHGASALAKENHQLKEERSNLKAAIHQLDARAQTCADSLNNARASVKKWEVAASNCSARISDEASREVSQKAVADVKKIRKAKDDLESTEADLDALRKENQDLKASVKDYEKRIAAFEGGGSKTSVMSQEVQECKKEKKSLQEDKEGLVKTVQHLLKANGTESLSQTLQKEVASLQKAQLETQRIYSKKVESLRDQLKTAQDNAQDVKEVAQTMNEQNAELTKNNDKLQSKLQTCEGDRKDLEDDKKSLVLSLQGTLRQNTEYQAQMAKEEIKRADNPKKKQQAQKKSQVAGNVLKGPGTSKDDEVQVMGDMRAMDHYIASATVDEPAQEIVSMPVPEEKEPPAQAQPKQKPVMPVTGPVRNKLSKYLNQPLFPPEKKELTPEEKAQQEAKKEADVDDNIGNDVGKLLSQAEDAVDQTSIDDDEAPTDEDVSDAQTLSDAAVLLQKSG